MLALKNNSLDFLFLLTILVTILVSISFLFEPAFKSVFSPSDDAYHLGVAKSLIEGKGFFTGYSPFHPNITLDDLIKYFPEIGEPLSIHGPVYYIILGFFYLITSPSMLEWNAFGSYFNIGLMLFFLILLYFLVRKYFGKKIAFISSLTFALLPFLVWFSVKILPHSLTYSFVIISLFFIDRNKTHYFLFGFFAGLANLTHQLGIILLASYLILLLIKKEFKGFLISLSTFFVVLFTWMIRNYYTFGDPSAGLAIPFSSTLKSISAFNDPALLSRISGAIQENLQLDLIATPFTSFNANLQLYQLQTFFLISLIGFVSIGIILFFYYSRKNLKNFLELDEFQLRLALLSLIGVFVSITVGLYFSANAGFFPQIHHLLPVFFLLIPFSFFTIKKFSHYFDKKFYKQFTFGILCSIFVILLGYNLFMGIGSVTEYIHQNKLNKWSEEDSNQLHNWLAVTVRPNATFATNEAGFLFLNTGLKSIGIPTDIMTEKASEKFIEHYKPDYVVWYGKSQKKFTENLTPAYYFQGIYGETSDDNRWRFDILKVGKQTEERLKEKISEHLALGQYSQAVEGYNFIVVFYDREIDQLKKSDQLDKANTVQLSLESITKERDDFVFTIADSNTKIIQKLVESNQYLEVMEVFEETNDIFEKYTKSEIINQEKKTKIQQLIEEFKIGQNRSLMAWDEFLRKEVSILLDLEDNEEAIEFYKSLRDYYQKKYKTFEKSGNFNDAKKIKNSLVEYVGYNAKLFMDHEMLHDAERAYLFLLNIDKYDRNVWAKFGELYERMGRLPEALAAYNKANFLPDKDYTDKIEELKNKLES